MACTTQILESCKHYTTVESPLGSPKETPYNLIHAYMYMYLFEKKNKVVDWLRLLFGEVLIQTANKNSDLICSATKTYKTMANTLQMGQDDNANKEPVNSRS